MKIYNNVYTDCFFIESVSMGFTYYYCNCTNTNLNNKCPKNCPHYINKDYVYDIVRKYVQKKEKVD